MKSIPKSNLDVVSFRFKLWLALKCSSLDKYRCSPNLITHHARGNIDPISKISSHPFTTQHVFGIAGQRVIILSHRFLNWKYRHAANFWWESAPLVLAMCMTRVHYIGPSLNQIYYGGVEMFRPLADAKILTLSFSICCARSKKGKNIFTRNNDDKGTFQFQVVALLWIQSQLRIIRGTISIMIIKIECCFKGDSNNNGIRHRIRRRGLAIQNNLSSFHQNTSHTATCS